MMIPWMIILWTVMVGMMMPQVATAMELCGDKRNDLEGKGPRNDVGNDYKGSARSIDKMASPRRRLHTMDSIGNISTFLASYPYQGHQEEDAERLQENLILPLLRVLTRGNKTLDVEKARNGTRSAIGHGIKGYNAGLMMPRGRQKLRCRAQQLKRILIGSFRECSPVVIEMVILIMYHILWPSVIIAYYSGADVVSCWVDFVGIVQTTPALAAWIVYMAASSRSVMDEIIEGLPVGGNDPGILSYAHSLSMRVILTPFLLLSLFSTYQLSVLADYYHLHVVNPLYQDISSTIRVASSRQSGLKDAVRLLMPLISDPNLRPNLGRALDDYMCLSRPSEWAPMGFQACSCLICLSEFKPETDDVHVCLFCRAPMHQACARAWMASKRDRPSRLQRGCPIHGFNQSLPLDFGETLQFWQIIHTHTDK